MAIVSFETFVHVSYLFISHSTVVCILNTQHNKNQLTRAFADGCQLHQLRHPGDVVWDTVRDGDDEAPRLPSPPHPRPVCLHFFLDDVVPYLW